MQVIESFENYLSVEKNYSPHTVKAYVSDVIEFEQFIKQEELARDLLDVTRDRLGRTLYISLGFQEVCEKIDCTKKFHLFVFFTPMQ